MRTIVLSGVLCAITAWWAPAQIIVQGGGASQGIPAGATIWYGAAAPVNSTGVNGDYYLDTGIYCLYGPKVNDAWPALCDSSVRQIGYVAENVGTKGAAGGYAPLDGNATVPASHLPVITGINGTSVPANAAADQALVTTGPATGAWVNIPACPDSGGFHLNYSAVMHGFLCGNTGGTVGSVNFSSVEAGTNSQSLLIGGDLSYTGAGHVNANQLSGVSLTDLPAGLLKITGGTGRPATASSTDVTATLGFMPENPVNKGAATGYAPLDASAKVPLTNLPAIPWSQTTGVQAALSYSPENASNRNAANGYAPLDANRLVPAANLPATTAINGTSIPVSSGADQAMVTTGPAAGAWANLPSCPDTGGNHLNYSTVTHGFVCGTTGGTAGSVQFGSVGEGTNANNLLVSGSLNYTGGGRINANQLNGVALAGLGTGLLKVTGGTGAPAIANGADLAAAIGFAPENAANRGAPNGYAALDANRLVPAASLPPVTAVNGTSMPVSSGADQAMVTTAPSTGAWTALPACPDTGGNHLNYNPATHSFLCGNTGGTAGSVQFGSVGGGTNPNSLLVAGSLSYTGTGQVNANQLSGVTLSGLNTGLLKITNGSGVPGTASSPDVVSALGFTPERASNRNSPNGYAPLDAGGLLPAANLPASAVTAATINDSSLTASLVTLTTTSDVDAGGDVRAGGNIYANSGSDAPGCLHLSDANGVHDMGICAPDSGFNGLLTLPPAAGTAGKALVSDGAGGSQWSSSFPALTIGSGATAAAVSAYADPAALGYNVFFGNDAGNQTMGPAGGSSGLASFNVGIGYSALNANTTGYQNIAIGQNALGSNTAGGQNVAIGSRALGANTSGSYNTAVGQDALGNNTTGYDNFAFGLRALYQNTTGYNNSAFGIDSVGINTTGYRNSGYGTDSCAWLVTGYENSCMGMNTLWSLTTGYDNASLGFNSMFGVSSGRYNTGLGAYADYYYPNTSTGVTLAATSGSSNLSAGWYWYKISYVLNGQETALSNNSYLGVLTDAGHREVTISGIPTYSGPFIASARKIYRTPVCPTTICTVITANQAPRRWYYVGTINNNTGTTYVDSVADASLGPEESGTPDGSIALGAYATVYKSYQMAVGSDASPIEEIWLGNGVTAALPTTGVQVSSSGASGTNVGGEDLILAGGPGTGSAAGGSAIFKYAPAGSPGSTWNALVESFRFTGTGAFRAAAGATLDMSGAAHTTPAKVGTAATRPGTCLVGEQYFSSDTAPGQNLSGCTSANTWTTLGGSGGGTVSSVFGRTGAVVAAAGDYTAAQVTNAVSALGSYSNPSWLTSVAFGGTNLHSAGGTIYNNAATGNTQLVFRNSASQAANGAGPIVFQNNAGATMSFINWDGGFAEGDGSNYKISLDTATAGFSSDGMLVWHNTNNVFGGAIDTGMARESAGVLKVTDGAGGYGVLDVGGLQVHGTALAAVATSGSAADLSAGTLPAARLPLPTPSTPGGVQAKDCSSGGQVLQKINTDGTVTCATPPGAAVTSVFGRTGAVVPAAGDYTADQITNALSATGSYSNPSWLTSVQFGGTTLNSTGGTIYNDAATGYTQLILQDSAAQAGSGQAQILLQNHAGANKMFLGPSSGFAVGDGTNWKSLIVGSTQLASTDFNFQFKNVNNVFSGTSDLGYARASAGVFKITNGASGYGSLDAAGYNVSGTAGLTVTAHLKGSDGNNCTMTFTGGLLTANTCP